MGHFPAIDIWDALDMLPEGASARAIVDVKFYIVHIRYRWFSYDGPRYSEIVVNAGLLSGPSKDWVVEETIYNRKSDLPSWMFLIDWTIKPE